MNLNNKPGGSINERLRKRRLYLLGACAFGVALVVCVVVLIVGYVKLKKAEDQYNQLQANTVGEAPVIVIEPEDPDSPELEVEDSGALSDYLDSTKPIPLPDDVVLPEKQVDFTQLQQDVNADIYAWIYVPNTRIDYPILQHPTNNSYYLEYNLDGTKGYPGCIYTELYNSKDFLDPVTVIYGHNMKNGTMFKDLHKFQTEDFFNENKYFFIYTPGQLLVYEIFSANTYSNAHILANMDQFDSTQVQNYIEHTLGLEQKGNFARTGDDLAVSIAESDVFRKLVVLSTCTGDSSTRYLVQGVLINKIAL